MPKRGRRRKKTRTHFDAVTGMTKEQADAVETEKVPRTFVVRHPYQTGKEVSQLCFDLRAAMQPFTASRIKERKKAALKDYVNVAGPLGMWVLVLSSGWSALL